jgi:hypothetical protein
MVARENLVPDIGKPATRPSGKAFELVVFPRLLSLSDVIACHRRQYY